ncbi:hypothetical protein [Corynebacterium glutamicum]|uniref:hypothetical protein n=1 Tax=Corynebacterium glutamicum TaxID=1718 RepID=UPI001B8AE6D5|nr:hypothetical protein [Corynebacterium glutamicum]
MFEDDQDPAFNADLPVNLGSVSIEYDGSITVNGSPATVKDLKAARNILDIALTIHWSLPVKDEAENRKHVRKDERREYDLMVEECIDYVRPRGSIPMSDLVRTGPLQGKWRDSYESIVEDMVATGKVEKRANDAAGGHGKFFLTPLTGYFAQIGAQGRKAAMNDAERREYDQKVESCTNYVLKHGSIPMSDLVRNGPLRRKWRDSYESIVEDMVATGKVEKQEIKAGQFRLVATHQSPAGHFTPITAQDVQAAMDDAEREAKQVRDSREFQKAVVNGTIPPRFENRAEANEFHKQKFRAIVRAITSQ